VDTSENLSTSLVSVVIPTYNSEDFLSITVSRVITSMERIGRPFEVILVNDGSHDGTWLVVLKIAEGDKRVTGINLLKNYGQHSALMCGLRHSRGSYVVTLDDDLQNPPEEISPMLTFCETGKHDLVIGEFLEPKKAKFRVLGTDVVNKIVTKVFNKPSDLKLSTFRVIRRDVVTRVCQSKNPTPYVTGELLYAAASIANLPVRHDSRIAGKSTYNPLKIFELVRRITFSYSIELLRITSRVGVLVSLFSFVLSGLLTARGVLTDGNFPGWTSMITAVSFFSAIIILLLSMMGEYLSVLLLQTSGAPAYRESAMIRNGLLVTLDTSTYLGQGGGVTDVH
jgi:glycosyltransferase involved in cell wall biosynthesis